MKTKTFALSLVFAFSAAFMPVKSDAQISLGGNLSYLKFLGSDLKTSHGGLGICGWYAKDNYTTSLTVNYFLTNKTSTTFPSLDTAGNPVSYEATVKVHVIQIDLRGNYYFVGEPEADFGFYGTAGLGILLESADVSYSGNFPSILSSSSASSSGFMIDLGIGAEKKFDFGFIFLNFGLSFPPFTANSQTGVETSTDLPGFMQLSSGIRLPLDK